MAKFCTKCGASLEDGKTCKCEIQKQKNDNFEKVSNYLKEYYQLVKRFIKEPINSLKEKNNEENFDLSLVSSSITSIIMGLLLCLITKNIFGGFSPLINIPYIKIFLIGFITMMILISVVSGITYLLIEKVFKGKTSLKKMFILFSISSIIMSVALLLVSILIILGLNNIILYIIIAISSLLWLSYNIKGLEYFSDIDANYIGYVISLTYCITTVVVYYLYECVILKVFI